MAKAEALLINPPAYAGGTDFPSELNSISHRLQSQDAGMPNIDPDIISKALCDLAQRLGLNENEVTEVRVGQADFPDASLGAPVQDEMSAQMITSGWRIRFSAGGETYEYRATPRQLRLVNFKGRNYRV